MESSSINYAFDAKSEALFKEADKLLDAVGPSILNDSDQAPPDTGKTPTTHDTHEAVLATAVDGGRGALCVDSTPSQGLHIIPPLPVFYGMHPPVCSASQ